MQTTYNQFLDGFAAGASVSRPSAESVWGSWSMEQPDEDKRANEAGGYDSGLSEGKRLSELHRMDDQSWDSEMITSDDWK